MLVHLIFPILCVLIDFSSSASIEELSSAASRSPGALGGTFDARHSFSPPFSVHGHAPFWEHSGSATVNSSFVRLTPAGSSSSIPNQMNLGAIWNIVPNSMADWEVHIQFHVYGPRSQGGSGFAFWYTRSSEKVGSVFGSADYWTGLGIFFDSQNQDLLGPNTMVTANFNDGTLKYDFGRDGVSDINNKNSYCAFEFRNNLTPSAVRIRYNSNQMTLQVFTSQSIGADGLYSFSECLTLTNIDLGLDNYFGLSASASDIGDNHDIYSFIAKDLTPPNTDFQSLRARFESTLQSLNSLPSHNQNSQDESAFQHSVLTSLSQIQSALNSFENDQLTSNDYIQNKFEMVVQPLAQLTNQRNNNFQQQNLIPKLQGETSDKLDNLEKTYYTLYNDVKNIKGIVTDINVKSRNYNSAETTHNPSFDPNNEISSLSQIISDQDRLIEGLLYSVQSIKSNNSDKKLIEAFSLSWIMLLVSAIILLIIAFHTYRQYTATNRYKMI